MDLNIVQIYKKEEKEMLIASFSVKVTVRVQILSNCLSLVSTHNINACRPLIFLVFSCTNLWHHCCHDMCIGALCQSSVLR